MGIDELVQGPGNRTGVVEGEVVRAPTSLNSPIHVRVLGLDDDEVLFGPCPWMPRSTALPSVGDPCAVAFSDSETPWVVAWWPQGVGGIG